MAANVAQNFDVELNLSRSDAVLTPLGVRNFDDVTTGNQSANSEQIKFLIDVKQHNVDQLDIVISNKSGVIFSQVLDPAMRSVGSHYWYWDGADTTGVFDTKQLKLSELSVELKAKLGAASKKSTLKIGVQPIEQDWVDVTVDKSKLKASVELRTNIKDGGSDGVGEPPPGAVQQMPNFKSYRPGDPKRTKHIRVKSFADLRALVLSAINRYWSRKVSTPSGTTYDVKVNAVHATKLAMDDIAIVYNTNREWVRSSNPGKVRGVYSLFGNLVPERIAYNVGWIQYANGWVYQRPFDAVQAFQETAAHELGHEILSAYGGDGYSYGHKGSSTVITQKKKKVGSGGVAYPAQGEIDLMKYYNGARPRNFPARVFASEQDVKSLFWLARVKFDV